MNRLLVVCEWTSPIMLLLLRETDLVESRIRLSMSLREISGQQVRKLDAIRVMNKSRRLNSGRRRVGITLSGKSRPRERIEPCIKRADSYALSFSISAWKYSK